MFTFLALVGIATLVVMGCAMGFATACVFASLALIVPALFICIGTQNGPGLIVTVLVALAIWGPFMYRHRHAR
jgi:hypothetical protein